MKEHISRRNFFTRLGAIGLLSLGASKVAWAQTKLDPNDQVAKALGYFEDASKVDTKKWTQWKPNRRCDNCNLYQKVDGDKGKCTIFQNKLVKAAGWCSTWIEVVKK